MDHPSNQGWSPAMGEFTNGNLGFLDKRKLKK